MGLLQKLKSTLGLGGSRSRRRAEHAGEVDVTVEHEPDATGEAAVKGSDDGRDGTTAGGTEERDGSFGQDETDMEGEAADEADVGAEADVGVEADVDTEADVDAGADAAGETDVEAAGAGVPVDELSGIGSAYADRLGNAGIESVADLTGADAASVAEASGIAQGRIEGWIEQAEEY